MHEHVRKFAQRLPGSFEKYNGRNNADKACCYVINLNKDKTIKIRKQILLSNLTIFFSFCIIYRECLYQIMQIHTSLNRTSSLITDLQICLFQFFKLHNVCFIHSLLLYKIYEYRTICNYTIIAQTIHNTSFCTLIISPFLVLLWHLLPFI